MNVNEIAKKLMFMRENRVTGYIMAGHVREELGFEGYGEALRLRWIEPDMDQSGMVTITNHLGKVAEMRQLAAEAKGACKCKGETCACGCKDGCCVCESIKESESSPGAHFFAQAHAFRRNAAGMGETAPVTEVATLGLGRTGEAPTTPVIGLGAQSAAPAPSQPSASPNPLPRPFPVQPGSSAQSPLGIGSDVSVVEKDGKQYTGKISRTLPDGKFEIGFAGQHPSVTRSYDKTEISALQAR